MLLYFFGLLVSYFTFLYNDFYNLPMIDSETGKVGALLAMNPK